MQMFSSSIDAPTFVPLGLAGGQGKTTVGLLLGRLIASYGIPVLFVDADPQASLTAFLGVTPSEDRPTLLEIITNPEKKVPLYSAIHPIPNQEKLFLIPATDQLENANHYLAASPMSLSILKNRLYQIGETLDPQERIANSFGLIIVDPPPERSHLALTSLGAGNLWAIPAEANVKGVQSLMRTLELIQTYQPFLPHGSLSGVIPFRARWVGLHPTTTTKQSMELMAELAGADAMLPHILESDVYKRAINDQVLPRDLGYPDLEYPLLTLLKRIEPALDQAVIQALSKAQEVV
jgi:chromosome partitioning protein